MHAGTPLRSAAALASALAVALLLGAEPAPPICSARAWRLGPWAHACTLHAPTLEAGSCGSAVAMSEGYLWIGPSRDADLGDGPPCVWALGLARWGCACDGEWIEVSHPAKDRTAAFGAAIAACGNSALIGAPAAGCDWRGACDAGEAFLATIHDSRTARMARLVPPSGSEPGAAFGAAVALSQRWAVVGSPRADDGEFDAGAVDVFDLTRGRRHTIRLAAPQPSLSGSFGAALAVSEEWLAVGEPGYDDPELGGPPFNAGCVHLYRWNGEQWSHFESLRSPAGAVGWYGASVALAGDVLIIGAPFAGLEGNGAIAVARFDGAHWRVQSVLSPPTDDCHGFGIAVALSPDGSHAIVGSNGDSAAAPLGGAAWATDFQKVWRLLCPTPARDQGLGAGVCMNNTLAAISSGGTGEQSPPPVGAVELLTRCRNRPRPP